LQGRLSSPLAAFSLAASCSVLLLACAEAARDRRHDVVLIVVDTLRADHLGCYGYPRNTSANIDLLAREAIVYKNAISQAPWTLPSVASLLTSQYPSVLGIYDRPVAFRPDYGLLQEQLKKKGYLTGGVVSVPLLSAKLGFGRGFDDYSEPSALTHSGVSSPAVTRAAISFLRKAGGRPFFLFVHYFDPHYSYVLHPEYDFLPSYRGSLGSGEDIRDLWEKRSRMSEDDIDYLVSLYDSEIAFTDRHVGSLLGELRRLGLYDESLIVLTGDHGEEFMERGWIGHTISLHGEVLHVPLLIKPPGNRSGVVETHVGLIDVMPTILSYLGFEDAPPMEGKSLEIDDPERTPGTPARPVFSETFNPQTHRAGVPGEIASRSVVAFGHKLVLDQIAMTRRVYDLSADPRERLDIAGKKGETQRRLEATLSDWMEHVARSEDREWPAEKGGLTEEQMEQLEALGYL
jgi:arylsulfatase A-like enzyme